HEQRRWPGSLLMPKVLNGYTVGIRAGSQVQWSNSQPLRRFDRGVIGTWFQDSFRAQRLRYLARRWRPAFRANSTTAKPIALVTSTQSATDQDACADANKRRRDYGREPTTNDSCLHVQ